MNMYYKSSGNINCIPLQFLSKWFLIHAVELERMTIVWVDFKLNTFYNDSPVLFF